MRIRMPKWVRMRNWKWIRSKLKYYYSKAEKLIERIMNKDGVSMERTMALVMRGVGVSVSLISCEHDRRAPPRPSAVHRMGLMATGGPLMCDGRMSIVRKTRHRQRIKLRCQNFSNVLLSKYK
ncbi:unnamed protein product [Nesidiocoris tenuis]|uniref:Uncharacterized protein n=1 Tax=Nesidiocoris tenuis TaxID=355587 RepID=A0A6H5GHC4_9HEMI|nr:unnamed protein product [Nesidiocoris tenuis]